MNDQPHHHAHFDEAKVIEQNAQFCARFADRIEKPGYEGAEARLKTALIPALNLAMVREINRVTAPEDFHGAIAALLAHVALTYTYSITGGPHGSDDSRCGVANLLMVEVGMMMQDVFNKGNAKSASRHYKTMPWPDLEALPVGHLAKANAVCLLWACPPTLEKSFQLLKRWGALYLTELVWRKVTINDKPRMGPGYRARGFHESVLVGVFGNERQIHDAFPSLFDGFEDPRDGVLFDGVAREHSRKPDEFYEMVLAKTPGANRCDIFSRSTHPGFDGWGDQHGKFDPAPMPDADLLNAVSALEGRP